MSAASKSKEMHKIQLIIMVIVMPRMTIMMMMAMTTMNVFHQGQIDHKLRPIRAAHQSEHSRPHVMSYYVTIVTSIMMNVMSSHVMSWHRIRDEHHDECHDKGLDERHRCLHRHDEYHCNQRHLALRSNVWQFFLSIVLSQIIPS